MNGPIFLENTVPMRPKTPEYILNHNDYPIKTSPRTPSGSPLKSPSEEKPLQQPSMDTILAAMEKVDKDIVVLDRVVKKVNNELQKQDKDEVKIEGIPVTPRKTEVSENVSLIEKIYEENRLKAEKATMSMYHLGCPLLEPNLPGVALYKQPSDLPQYHENNRRWREGTFKKALVEYLWKKKLETDEKVCFLASFQRVVKTENP